MLALAVSFVTVGYAAVTFFAETARQERLRDELRTEIDRAAAMSGELLAGAIWSLNKESVIAGLEVLLTHEDIVAAVARDAEGNVLAWCHEEAGSVTDCEKELWTELDSDPDRHHLSTPVFSNLLDKRQTTGELQVYYTQARLAGRLYERLERAAWVYLALVAALAGAILLATHRAVLTPLARWRRAFHQSAEIGMPNVDWASADEIGVLIREYNERADQERAKLRELLGRLRTFQEAFESLHSGFCIFDREFRLVAFNRRYVEIMDHGEGAIETGMGLSTLLRANAAKGEYGSADIDAVIIDRLAIASANERYRRERERPDGSLVEIESSPMPDGGFVSIYTDVSRERAREAQLRQMTLQDPLTHLPNRALFHDRLRQALMLADRLRSSLAVHLIDLDGFSHVNQLHGRGVGDEILNQVGERLSSIVRKSDTAARLESDRFAVIQQHLPSVDDAALLAHRLLGAISRTFEAGDVSLKATASIGITLYPDDDRDSGNVMKHIHLALTSAKAEGRRRYRFFSLEVDRDVARRRRLEEELFESLRETRFLLRYQPRLDLMTGALAGAEAHACWDHPEKGLLAPAEFMKFVEERGLIVPLSEWMLKQACRQRLEWQGQTDGLWRVAVPLSRRHFEEGDVVASVRAALDETALDPHFLEVEISAETLQGDTARLAEGLRGLRSHGVTLMLEAFGNGSLPFHSIRRLPIDALKIDPSLVREHADPESAAIIRAVIGLGQRLDLRVGAAGVDRPEQLEQLKAEGCDEVQGELVSGPLASDELILWLNDRE